jgi:hypothetical protein
MYVYPNQGEWLRDENCISDLTILFISQTQQRPHVDTHWPLSKYT